MKLASVSPLLLVALASPFTYGQDDEENRDEPLSVELDEGPPPERIGGEAESDRDSREPPENPGETELEVLIDEARDLQRHMARLAREGKREASEEFRHLLEEFLRDHPAVGRFLEEVDLHPEGPERRIHHLLRAAENLERAGLHEEARDIREQAEELERDVQMQRRREQEQRKRERRARESDALRRELEEVKEILRNLQDEFRELRESLRESRVDETR